MAEHRQKRKKTVGGVISNLVLILAVAVFLFSAYQLFHIFMEYKKGSDEYDKIREYVEEPAKEEKNDTEEKEIPLGPQVDFEALKAINPDIIGWIQMDALEISYPVVQGKDNDHYLHYTFEGQRNAAGTIFVDSENKSDFEDCNTLIYGHNMKNGSMFGKFRTLHDPEKLTSPYLFLCTPDKTYRYEIFSVHTTSATGEVYTFFNAHDEEFGKYLTKMKEESEFPVGGTPVKEDKIVTLSTCTGNDATRFVIQARRLPEEYR